MSIKILRQLNFEVAEGAFSELSEASVSAFKGIDVPDKYKLVVEPGLVAGGFFSLAGSTAHTIQLPEGYSSANRLFVLLSALGQVRVTVVSPAYSNSVFTLNGATTLEATTTWCGRVTSITVTTPSATAVKVRYSCFELPDITAADSYFGGVYNYGILT